MNNENAIEFCIAQNLAKALGFEKQEDIIWRLFLSMDIMGFQYNGLKSNKYEILNGLNGTCRDFVDRSFEFFGLFKQTVDYRNLISYDYKKNLVLEVDDYYLEYHPYFKKNHHIRYILLTAIHNNVVTIYDMGTHQINLNTIKQAVVDAFFIGENKKIKSNIKDITNNLVEFYENKNWIISSGGMKSISFFKKDLEENSIFLKKADFESLYYFVNKLGGPTQSTKFMYIALTSLLEYIGYTSEKLILLKDIISKLTCEWDILGNTFFRMSRKFNEQMYERVEKRIDGILELELQLENL